MVFRKFYLLLTLTLLVSACAEHRKVSAQQPQTNDQQQQPIPAPNENPDVKEKMKLYETFFSFRDGKPVNSNFEDREIALKDYEEDYSKNLMPYNQIIMLSSNDKCKRYIELFNTLNLQLISASNSYLYSNLSTEQSTMTHARAEILNFLDSSFVNLALMGNEVGQFELDPYVQEQCEVPDRNEWKNRMLHNYQKMQAAYANDFGEQSYESPVTLANSVYKIKNQYETDRKRMDSTVLVGETFSSGLLWNRSVTAIASVLRSTMKATPIGRYATLCSSMIYLAGWVGIDHFARAPFSAHEINITNDSVLSSWNNLMTQTKTFTDSSLMSPDLYYGYLQLIDLAHRQEALSFLTKNDTQLKDAEQKYSTIDEAYKKLKEEQTLWNETN